MESGRGFQGSVPSEMVEVGVSAAASLLGEGSRRCRRRRGHLRIFGVVSSPKQQLEQLEGRLELEIGYGFAMIDSRWIR